MLFRLIHFLYQGGSKNPIYLFYEKVERDKDGEVGADGDRQNMGYLTVYVLCFIFIVKSKHIPYADELKLNRYSRLCWIMHPITIHLWMASLREHEQKE
jgi:hypothetical protein